MLPLLYYELNKCRKAHSFSAERVKEQYIMIISLQPSNDNKGLDIQFQINWGSRSPC